MCCVRLTHRPKRKVDLMHADWTAVFSTTTYRDSQHSVYTQRSNTHSAVWKRHYAVATKLTLIGRNAVHQHRGSDLEDLWRNTCSFTRNRPIMTPTTYIYNIYTSSSVGLLPTDSYCSVSPIVAFSRCQLRLQVTTMLFIDRIANQRYADLMTVTTCGLVALTQ